MRITTATAKALAGGRRFARVYAPRPPARTLLLAPPGEPKKMSLLSFSCYRRTSTKWTTAEAGGRVPEPTGQESPP
jgi:hypothetical protein